MRDSRRRSPNKSLAAAAVVVWLGCLALTLGFWGVVLWAIIRIVQHLT